MSDEDPKIEPEAPKRPKKGSHGFGKRAKHLPPNLREVERERIKALREHRIEQIAGIMAQICTKSGKPSWDRKVAKALGASWGLAGSTVRLYASIASKRNLKMLSDVEFGRIGREVLHQAIARAHHKKDEKALATYIQIALKAAEAQAAEAPAVEVTPAAAQAAVVEMFGSNAAKHDSPATPAVEPDPFPSPASPGCPPDGPPAQ